MKIKSIKSVTPRTVYAITTSTSTFIADGLAHHNCVHCNIMLKSNPQKYFLFMENKYGREVVDELIILSNKSMKLSMSWYQEQIEYYEEEVKQLMEEKC